MLNAATLKKFFKLVFLSALAATSLDVKAAPEIQNSDVRLIDTLMSALLGDVGRYKSELPEIVSLPKIGISVCSCSSC